MKFKMYERLHDDDLSVMHVNSVPQWEVMAIQGQGTQPVN